MWQSGPSRSEKQELELREEVDDIPCTLAVATGNGLVKEEERWATGKLDANSQTVTNLEEDRYERIGEVLRLEHFNDLLDVLVLLLQDFGEGRVGLGGGRQKIASPRGLSWCLRRRPFSVRRVRVRAKSIPKDLPSKISVQETTPMFLSWARTS